MDMPVCSREGGKGPTWTWKRWSHHHRQWREEKQQQQLEGVKVSQRSMAGSMIKRTAVVCLLVDGTVLNTPWDNRETTIPAGEGRRGKEVRRVGSKRERSRSWHPYLLHNEREQRKVNHFLTGCHNDIDKEKQERDQMSFLPVDAVIGISGKLRRKEGKHIVKSKVNKGKWKNFLFLQKARFWLAGLRRWKCSDWLHASFQFPGILSLTFPSLLDCHSLSLVLVCFFVIIIIISMAWWMSESMMDWYLFVFQWKMEKSKSSLIFSFLFFLCFLVLSLFWHAHIYSGLSLFILDKAMMMNEWKWLKVKWRVFSFARAFPSFFSPSSGGSDSSVSTVGLLLMRHQRGTSVAQGWQGILVFFSFPFHLLSCLFRWISNCYEHVSTAPGP